MTVRTTFVSLVSLLMLAACGGGSTGTDAGGGGTDTGGGGGALVGTWFAQVTPVTSDNQTATLVFNADGSYSLTHSQMDSLTSADHPGCTETQADVGTYTSDATNVTFTPTTATSGVVTYTGCMNAADNGAGPMRTPQISGAAMYTIVGTTLTITSMGSLGTMFTRQ
jgi:hypothetical protein